MVLLATLSALLLGVTTWLFVQVVGRSKDAEERFEQLVRAAPDMIITFDLAGHFVDVNPATLAQSGYTLEELKALPITAFFPNADAWRLISALRDLKEGGEREITVRYRTKGFVERWVSCRATTIRHAGQPTGILVIARDVTDDMVRTQALRGSEERFRSLISALDRAFFVQDPDGRFAGLFGRWVKSTGIDPAKFLGRTVREVGSAQAADAHEAAFARAMGGEDATYETEVTGGEEGRMRTLRVSLAPMHDARGGVIGVAGVVADVSRRIRAEEEAQALRVRVAEAERVESLGKLVSGVAHELNNPLAAILNFAEDLLLDEREGEERAALEIIQAQALRSRTIVRDLLTFVRRDIVRPRVCVAVGPVIDAMLRALAPGLPVGVRLRTALEDGETPIDMDRTGFEQVLTNLVTNAAQAAPKGHVWITSARLGSWFEVRVEDDGTGIAAEHNARIFEPFFTTKPPGQGVGLGLSVSLGIVQAHGGTIVAENRTMREGGGARFILRFPVSQITIAPIEEPHTPSRRRPSLTPVPGLARLLVVDDEAPIRRALRRYFERRGWGVVEAEDGAEALAALTGPDATLFDVVLCDLKMPGLSGPELYERLKLEAPGVLQRIIFVTGDVTGSQAAAFLSQVPGPVLEKPFELATVGALAEEMRSTLHGARGGFLQGMQPADNEGMRFPVPAPDAPHLLIVDDEDALRLAVVRWFTRRGWKCAEAGTLAAAERLLFSGGAVPPDVILCDLRLPDGNGEELLDRVLRERPTLVRRMIIASGEVLPEEMVERLAEVGCRTLTKPFDLSEVEAVARSARDLPSVA